MYIRACEFCSVHCKSKSVRGTAIGAASRYRMAEDRYIGVIFCEKKLRSEQDKISFPFFSYFSLFRAFDPKKEQGQIKARPS